MASVDPFEDLPEREDATVEIGRIRVEDDSESEGGNDPFADLPEAGSGDDGPGVLQTAEDLARSFAAGTADLQRAGAWLVGQAGAEQFAEDVRENAKWFEEGVLSGQSEEAQADRGKRFVETDEEGDYSLGEGATDPGTLAHTIARSGPSIITSLLGGAGLTGMLRGTGVGAKTSAAAGFGTSEGIIAGAQSGASSAREVRETSFEQLREQSPAFRKLEDKIGDPEAARDTLADEVSEAAAVLGGLTAAAAGAPSGVALSRIFRGRGLARTRAGATGKGALIEAAQESVQEGGQTLSENYAAAAEQYDPEREITEDALNNMFAGAVAGGGIGGPLGFAAGPDTQASDTEQTTEERADERQGDTESAPETEEQPAAPEQDTESRRAYLQRRERNLAAQVERANHPGMRADLEQRLQETRDELASMDAPAEAEQEADPFADLPEAEQAPPETDLSPEAPEVEAAREQPSEPEPRTEAPQEPAPEPQAEPADLTEQQLRARATERRRLAEQTQDPNVRADLQRQAQADEAEVEGRQPKLSRQERQRRQRIVRPESDDLLTAIQKLGGLNTDIETDFTGRLKGLERDRRPGMPGLEQSGDRGDTMDGMAERLHELGYLRTRDASELEDRLLEAEARPVYSLQADAAAVERETEELARARERGDAEESAADPAGRQSDEETAATAAEVEREAPELLRPDEPPAVNQSIERMRARAQELAPDDTEAIIEQAARENWTAEREQDALLQTIADAAPQTTSVGGRKVPGVKTFEEFQRESDRGDLEGQALGFLDLDNFKALNDSMGHEIGDDVIRAFGQTLREYAGPRAVYRRSGDEFIVRGDDRAALEDALRQAQNALEDRSMTIPQEDGSEVTLDRIRFSYGVGESLREAEQAQEANKTDRRRAGLRKERDGADRRAGSDRRAGDEGRSEQPGGQDGGGDQRAQPAARSQDGAERGADERAGARDDPSRAVTGQQDLAGPVDETAQAQADADAERRRRAAESPPVESEDGDLFSGRSRQTDIEDVTEAPAESGASSSGGIDARANEAATSPENDRPEPTEAQKEAGNYRLGDIEVQGFDIAIENPRGSWRWSLDTDAVRSALQDLPQTGAVERALGELDNLNSDNVDALFKRLNAIAAASKQSDAKRRLREALDNGWRAELPAHYGYFRATEGNDGDAVDAFVGRNTDATTAYVVDQTDPDRSTFDEHKVMLGYESEQAARDDYLAAFEGDFGQRVLGAITPVSTTDLRSWIEDGDQSTPYSDALTESTTADDAPARDTARDLGLDGAVYHGTAAGVDFSRFDDALAGTGVGSNAFDQGDRFYLTPNREAAEWFARRAEENRQLQQSRTPDDDAQGAVLAFRLRPDARILEIDNMPRGRDRAQSVVDRALADGYDAIKFPDRGFETIEGDPRVYDMLQRGLPDSIVVLNRDAAERTESEASDAEGVREDTGSPDQRRSVEEEGTGESGQDLEQPASGQSGDREGARAAEEEGGQQDVTESAAFRRWFGDSKVVDANGDPLVVYHGTADGQFEAFDPERAGDVQHADWGRGIYFDPDPSGADYYRREALKEGSADVDAAFERYEELVKPAGGVLQDLPEPQRTEAEQALREFRRLSREAGDQDGGGRVIPAYVSLQNPLDQEYTPTPNPDLAREARERGHDGIIVRTPEGKIDEVIAFRPEQVKHATDNRGTFDPADPRMTFSRPDPIRLENPAEGNGSGLSVDQVTRAVADARLRMVSGPPVNVVQSVEDLPRSIQPYAREGAAPQGVAREGQVWLIADNLRTAEDARRTLAHEAVGHIAMEEMLGEQFEPVMERVQRLKEAGNQRVNRIAEDVRRRYGEVDPMTESREIVAIMAEEGVRLPIMKEVVAAVRRFLRRIGLGIRWSRTELEALIAKAGRRLQRDAAVGASRDDRPAAFSRDEQTESPKDIAQTLRDTYEGLQLDVSGEAGGVVTIDKIVVPESERQAGIGTAVMKVLTAYADRTGSTLALSPSNDFGGNVARLRSFYANFGFTPNRGRNRDFEVSESMLRRPGVPRGEPMFSRPDPDDSSTLAQARRKAGLGRRRGTLRDFAVRLNEITWEQTKAMLGAAREQAAQGIFDRFHGIKRAERSLGNLPTEQSGYVAARMSTGMSSVMRGIMLHGAPKWENGMLAQVEGSRGMLEILEPVRGDIETFLGWMVGRRANRLMQEGREQNLTQEEIDALIEAGEASPHFDQFEAVADELDRFKKHVLDVAEDAGLIDPETRPTWDQSDYIPFYRVAEESEAPQGQSARQSLAGQSSGIRTLRGGEDVLNDPLENMIMNFSHLIDASMKNHAVRQVVNNIGADGVMEEATSEFKPELIPLSQIRSILQERGVDTSIIPNEALRGMQKMWASKPPADEDIIRMMDEGKARYFRVNDPLLLRSLTAVRDPGLNHPIVRTMRGFKRILTRGVTADPAFMARNYLRDALHAWVINEDHFRVGIDSIRGATKSLTEQGGMVDMMFAGGSFQGGYVNANDPGETARAIRRALREQGYGAAARDRFVGTVVDTPIKFWEKYTKIGDAIENASREAVYEAAINAGKSRQRAVFEAKDLMDYSMRGDWAIMQFFGDVLPFFNARVQGLYKLGRAGVQNPKQIAARGSMIAMASLALLALNKDDERYEELPEWDKDTYWHLFFPESIVGADAAHIRIPKPFEIGVLFGTIPERWARNVLGKDDTEKTFERMLWSVRETFAFDPVPQAFKPGLEVWGNRDTFMDAPIEGLSDQGKLKEARYDPRTSATMKALGQITGPAANTSPKQLEHLWRGYTGSMGMYLLDLSDLAVRSMQGAPPRPEPRIDDYPVIQSFLRAEPARSTKYLPRLYDLHREANQIYRTLNEYRKSGNEEKAREILEDEDKKAKLAVRGALEKGVSANREISRTLDQIHRDRTMTPAEKREAIDKLIAERNQITKEVVQSVDKALTELEGE